MDEPSMLRESVPVSFDGPSVLKCPRCGGVFVRQASVCTDWRDFEDGPGTRVSSGIGGDVVTIRVRSDQIPGRRSSMDVHYICESCGVLPYALRIAQHKGQTIVEWVLEFDPGPTSDDV